MITPTTRKEKKTIDQNNNLSFVVGVITVSPKTIISYDLEAIQINPMKVKKLIYLFLTLLTLSCDEYKETNSANADNKAVDKKRVLEVPKKNKEIVNIVKKHGPEISLTYKKAVCTELVIQVLEKVQNLNDIDKARIRIITDKKIQELLKDNSMIPKGVYFSLIEKGIGIPIDNKNEVCEGDFVQFWTESWGHCGIVKTINLNKNEMELYSSFPSTNGYGIQKFNIPKHSFFVRLK